MKTLVLSMISIAATLAAMTACTSESDPVDEIDVKVPIALNAGVIQTKAAIDTDESNHPKDKVSNVHFYRIDATTEPTDWTTPTAKFSGAIETTGSISGIEQYYATNGDNAFITGLYLGDKVASAPEIATGKASFTIDGSDDILFAQSVDMGNRGAQKTTALNFQHKLTQFKFTAKVATGLGDIPNVSINITNAKKTSAISLASGDLETWTDALSLTIPNLTATEAGGTSAGFMLEPNLKNLQLSVSAPGYLANAEVLTINGTEGASTDTFLPGKSYVITINFSGKKVTATATIGKWEPGTNPGEGSIE